MADLREQVAQLASEGCILDVAAAVVGGEQERLISFGEHRAKWEPSPGAFAVPIGLPDIEFIEPPRMEQRQPVVAALGAVVFRVGAEDDGESFRVEPSFERELAGDELVVDILRTFARVYCLAEYTRGRPATRILARPATIEVESGPLAGPAVVTDSRKLIPGLRYVSAPLRRSHN